jgi:hypothetical protein
MEKGSSFIRGLKSIPKIVWIILVLFLLSTFAPKIEKCEIVEIYVHIEEAIIDCACSGEHIVKLPQEKTHQNTY